MITTYERDSIWSSEKARVASSEVILAERKVRVRTRLYRYQEVAPRDVVRLLENPRGTIPISRPMTPSLPPADLARLLTDFRALVAQPK